MGRWEYIKLHYYHHEDPEKSSGFFSFLNTTGHYERKEIKGLEQALAQLEREGWKIDKVSQPAYLVNLERLGLDKRKETFQLTKHTE
jgi:hypothetical protein